MIDPPFSQNLTPENERLNKLIKDLEERLFKEVDLKSKFEEKLREEEKMRTEEKQIREGILEKVNKLEKILEEEGKKRKQEVDNVAEEKRMMEQTLNV